MINVLELLFGPPLPTLRLAEERLNKVRALAAFSPDALSSIAYANQEIFLGLLVASAAGLAFSWPIAVAITVLLSILSAGLVAAAALMIDYVLTAAVSLTAGVAAIASAFPGLWPYRVHLSLFKLQHS